MYSPNLRILVAFPGTSVLLLRAWELNFNHAGVAFVDNCITGFLKAEDLRNTIDLERSASMEHWGGCLSVTGQRGELTPLPPFFPHCVTWISYLM